MNDTETVLDNKEDEMNKKSDRPYTVDKPVTILGNETSLTGDLSFKTSLKICGEFKGSIKTEGYLEIAPDAKVEAEIEAASVKIAGYLKGNINKSDRIELISTAQMVGNMTTKILKIEDGVLFQGECKMVK